MDNVPPPTPPPFVPPGSPPPGQPPYPGQPMYPGQPYPGQMPPPQRGWWSRNWLWFVPTGCVSLLVVLALFIGGIVSLVFGVMKASDVYKTALSRAKASPEVAAALGTPINEGYVVSGSVNTSGDTGDAKIDIPVSGPKDKGTIHVQAEKSGGVWSYSRMIVHVDGSGQDIDINQPSP